VRTASWLLVPTSKPARVNAADVPVGGADVRSARSSSCSASDRRSGSRNVRAPPTACRGANRAPDRGAWRRILELAQQGLDARRRGVRGKDPLERSGAIPLALPVLDRLDESRLPLFDVVRDGHRDVREKILKLAARLGRRIAAAALVGEIAQNLEHLVRLDLFAAEGLIGDEAIERPLQLAHVLEFQPPELVDDAAAKPTAALLALGGENRHARFVIRHPHIHDQSAREPRDQPLIDVGDVRRRPVARHDDLTAVGLQRLNSRNSSVCVSGVLSELHVVDQSTPTWRYISLNWDVSPAAIAA
jgi:hypothetical protein